MTAAAAAARGADTLADRAVSHATLLGFGVVVLGGLVEGTALGTWQSRALGAVLGDRGRRRWLLATLMVAGLGWAIGSAPATLAGDPGGGTQPGLLVVLAGAAALGAGMGAVLGAAQTWALRGHVRHPWRWVPANALGWAAAMPVIFLGATTAGADWRWPWVVLLGTVTGAAAGLVLGVVTAPALATLDGPPLRHRIVLGLLGSRARRLAGVGLAGLAVTGARTGRTYRFPVMAADIDHERVVVLPGHADHKIWWRNLPARPTVGLLRDGHWQVASAELVSATDPRHGGLATAYADRWPRVAVGAQTLVLVTLGAAPASAATPESSYAATAVRASNQARVDHDLRRCAPTTASKASRCDRRPGCRPSSRCPTRSSGRSWTSAA